MKLGLSLPYNAPKWTYPVERVLRAEQLGYDSLWTAETYGTDALTPLAYYGALTKKLRLGTGIMHLAAHSPAAAAMAYQTIDALTGGGRVIAGIGVSGPQIVEGWHGQPWGRPNPRLRDYVTIMRKIFDRDGPVSHDGSEIALPYKGPGAAGLGKPLKSILHTNKKLPITLGTGTDANIILTAEIADGWQPLGFVPGRMPSYMPLLEEGFRRAGNGKSLKDFEIWAGVWVFLTDDVKGALAEQREHRAFMVGGMGAQSKNFHKESMVKRGYGDVAARVQELFLAGRREEAAAAIPDEYVDDEALIGPPARIKERWRKWADAGLTGVRVVTEDDRAIDLMAEIGRE